MQNFLVAKHDGGVGLGSSCLEEGNHGGRSLWKSVRSVRKLFLEGQGTPKVVVHSNFFFFFFKVIGLVQLSFLILQDLLCQSPRSKCTDQIFNTFLWEELKKTQTLQLKQEKLVRLLEEPF